MNRGGKQNDSCWAGGEPFRRQSRGRKPHTRQSGGHQEEFRHLPYMSSSSPHYSGHRITVHQVFLPLALFCCTRRVPSKLRHLSGAVWLDHNAARRCLLLFLLCSTGCVASKRAYLVIPVCCSRVNSESFTRPCASRTGGELVCDGVVVTPNCVALRPGGR